MGGAFDRFFFQSRTEAAKISLDGIEVVGGKTDQFDRCR